MSTPPPADPGPAPAAPASPPTFWGPLVPLLIAAVALGVVVLAPNLYSDPNGLDPYTLRTSGVALGLLAVSLEMCIRDRNQGMAGVGLLHEAVHGAGVGPL